MENYSPGAQPWAAHRDAIEFVRIGDGVTVIGDYAFYEFTKLHQVTINSQTSALHTIGERAFKSCNSLGGVFILPEGLLQIGPEAFMNCRNLRIFDIPASVRNFPATNRTSPGTTSPQGSPFFNAPNVVLRVHKDSPAHTYAWLAGNNFIMVDADLNYAQFLYDTLSRGGPRSEYGNIDGFAVQVANTINRLHNDFTSAATRHYDHIRNVSIAAMTAGVPVDVGMAIMTAGATTPDLIKKAGELFLSSAEIITNTDLFDSDEHRIHNEALDGWNMARNGLWDLQDLHDEIRASGGRITSNSTALSYINAYDRIVIGMASLQFGRNYFEGKVEGNSWIIGTQRVLLELTTGLLAGPFETPWRVAQIFGMEVTDLQPLTLPTATLGPSAVVHEYRKKIVDYFVDDLSERYTRSAFGIWRLHFAAFLRQQDVWLNGDGFGTDWHDHLFVILNENR